MRYLSTSLLFLLPAALMGADLPEQAKRGKELFNLKSSAGYACSTCHELGGEGVAVGPDLKSMGRLHPRAVVMGILATRTQYVVEVSPKGGAAYPAIQSGETYYDLSKNPPATVKPTPGEIKGARDNATWKHPPESRGLTKQQLADVVAYIRFVTTGDTKGVDVKDIP